MSPDNSSANYPCPYCSTPFHSHDELKAHVVAEHGAQPLPRPYGLVTITVNGQRYEHRVEANTTLYHLIHDPRQTKNVIREHPEVAKRMAEHLTEIQK